MSKNEAMLIQMAKLQKQKQKEEEERVIKEAAERERKEKEKMSKGEVQIKNNEIPKGWSAEIVDFVNKLLTKNI